MAASFVESSMNLQIFTLFPKFPVEIRLQIWNEFTMLEPRVVEVCLIQYPRNSTKPPLFTTTRLPSIFTINHESRDVALKTYPASFSSGEFPAQIRWNPAIDTIFLPAWCFEGECTEFMCAATQEEKSMIQKLAFELLTWEGRRNCNINEFIQIDEFPNLREVVLVHRLPNYVGHGCGYHYYGRPEEGVAGLRVRDDGSARTETEEEGVGVSRRARAGRNRVAPAQQFVATFATLHKNDPSWRIPVVKNADLTRDGRIR